MTYTFRVVFSGLCAFVPNQPLTEAPATSALVLLRDLREGLQLPKGDVPPHFPMVQFDARTLRRDSSTRSTDLPDEGLGLCILDGEDVEIWPGGHPPPTGNIMHNDKPPIDPDKPTPEEKKSLFWLPKMEQVTKKNVYVKKELVGPLDENEDFLIARVYLATGKLSTRKLQDGSWKFVSLDGTASGDPAKPKKLARSLALEITLEQDVTLMFQPFGSEDQDYLVLGQISDDPKEIVEVEIMNQEFPYPSEGEDDPSPNYDQDFAIYYGFLDGYRGPTLVPRLEGEEPRVVRMGGCTPAAMNLPPGSA